MTYLTAAYLVIWALLAIFLWRMGNKLKSLETELVRLEGTVERERKKGGNC